MQAVPYLLFNGQCEAAFKFYANCLGGKIQAMIPFGGTPAEHSVSAEWHHKIMHASMTVGDAVIMGSDCPLGRYQSPQGFSVALQIKKPAEAERVYHALAQEGTVTMPIQETFWSLSFGMLVDQFGIPWMINCQRDG
jgi:PhnB protein